MTLQELLEKNKRIKLARELKKQVEHSEIKEEPIIEETPHKEVIEEPVIEEGQKDIENQKKEAKKAPSKGKKPANRSYMVVENIEEVNK